MLSLGIQSPPRIQATFSLGSSHPNSALASSHPYRCIQFVNWTLTHANNKLMKRENYTCPMPDYGFTDPYYRLNSHVCGWKSPELIRAQPNFLNLFTAQSVIFPYQLSRLKIEFFSSTIEHCARVHPDQQTRTQLHKGHATTYSNSTMV